MERVRVSVDGLVVEVTPGATVLEACDAAGRYVPRLCCLPSIPSCGRCVTGTVTPATADATSGAGAAVAVATHVTRVATGYEPTDLGAADCRCASSGRSVAPQCGLCLVSLGGPMGGTTLACVTPVQPGMEITTDNEELRLRLLDRLPAFLARHPHICLSCPDREGCARDECRFGVPPEARCCDEFGHCEFGRLVEYLDPQGRVARRAVGAPRAASREGRLRREPGLCLGCGRCVTVCSTSPDAGDVLELRERSGLWTAWPKNETLLASGCTFCGQCALVCPAGAITASGPQGREWLEQRRRKYRHLTPVRPPQPWLPLVEAHLSAIPAEPGVFRLADAEGEVIRISGCVDLRQGLAEVCAANVTPTLRFCFEVAPLYTERETELLALFAQEHGHLPRDNDLSDDLFAE